MFELWENKFDTIDLKGLGIGECPVVPNINALVETIEVLIPTH